MQLEKDNASWRGSRAIMTRYECDELYLSIIHVPNF